MKYSVNGRQPGNNFLWDKSTILSTVSIWEINFGKTNSTMRSKTMTAFELILEIF